MPESTNEIDYYHKLTALYHPVFSKDSADVRIAHAKDSVKRLGIKAPLRNHIKEYISQYGDFHFSKQETVSGDVIRFDSWVMALYNPYWEEFHERVAFLGGYRNCSCSLCGRQETFYIEAFYMNSAGCIYNQRRELIAENAGLFWKYVMETEYDFHPQISDSTLDVLRRVGWYPERRITIDPLIEACMDDDILLTDLQIAFIEEFGGIHGADLNGCGFFIEDTRRDRCYANIAKEAVRTEERWILRNYGWDTICVGFCNQGEDMIWLTPFGQIVIRQEAVGRTFMEAVNCIVGY